jgi:hypothetical protein
VAADSLSRLTVDDDCGLLQELLSGPCMRHAVAVGAPISRDLTPEFLDFLNRVRQEVAMIGPSLLTIWEVVTYCMEAHLVLRGSYAIYSAKEQLPGLLKTSLLARLHILILNSNNSFKFKQV